MSLGALTARRQNPGPSWSVDNRYVKSIAIFRSTVEGYRRSRRRPLLLGVSQLPPPISLSVGRATRGLIVNLFSVGKKVSLPCCLTTFNYMNIVMCCTPPSI